MYLIMKHLLLILLSTGIMVSCMIQEGTGTSPSWMLPEKDKPITLYFSSVSLSFNLTQYKDYDFNKFDPDYWELCTNHGITYRYDHSGSVTSLFNILYYENAFEDKRKPSIVLKLSCLHNEDSTKVFSKEEVGIQALQNIPYLNTYQSHTLTIKSLVTKENEIQIIWENSSSGFDKWKSLNVTGNIIDAGDLDEETVSTIIKSGIKKSNGDFAVRPSSGGYYDIILNTLEDDSEMMECLEEDVFVDDDGNALVECEVECEEEPLISPTLSRPVYSGGIFQSNIRWRVPIVLTNNNN